MCAVTDLDQIENVDGHYCSCPCPTTPCPSRFPVFRSDLILLACKSCHIQVCTSGCHFRKITKAFSVTLVTLSFYLCSLMMNVWSKCQI